MKLEKLTRRQSILLGFGSFITLYMSPLLAATEKLKSVTRLSWLAHRGAKQEGSWRSYSIEGVIPDFIKGKLLRIGPGTKETQGTKLRHFFDGDAYLQQFSFGGSDVGFKASFVETSDREAERRAGKMLFNEFGTVAPKKTRRLKNQPNVNIIPWQKNYLALSEGGHPSLLDGGDFSFIKYWDFHGTLDRNVTFSAHPKFEADGKIGYGFGTKKGISKALVVYKMDSVSGELIELYNLPQKKVHMIHDMMMTRDYLLFYIAPAFFKLTDIIFNRGSMADALQFQKSLGGRLIVLDKEGKEKPIEIAMPGYMSFHHGNAFQEGDSISFTSFVAKDDSILKLIANWHGSGHSSKGTPSATQFRVNLKNKSLESEIPIAPHHDFPTLNWQEIGEKQEFLYAVQMGGKSDPMAFGGISKISIKRGVIKTVAAAPSETFGEPVYKKFEEDEVLFVPGYSKDRDESFVQIFNASDLASRAKIWMGGYYPLGFHGNFIGNS